MELGEYPTVLLAALGGAAVYLIYQYLSTDTDTEEDEKGRKKRRKWRNRCCFDGGGVTPPLRI